MHRRHFISLTAGVLTLSACGSGSNSTALDTVVSDVNLIASAFQNILPQIAAANGITPDMEATISAAITDLQTIATELRTTHGLNEAQPLVKQVEDDLNVIILNIGKLHTIPTSIAVVLQAASVLLPVIENAVALQVPPKVALRATSSRMTTDQARSVLRTAH